MENYWHAIKNLAVSDCTEKDKNEMGYLLSHTFMFRTCFALF